MFVSFLLFVKPDGLQVSVPDSSEELNVNNEVYSANWLTVNKLALYVLRL